MNTQRMLPLILACIAVAALWAGCADPCADVVCGPAPIPLQVTVYDTVTVDTQLVVVRGVPLDTVRVDTQLVVTRPTVDALVTLRNAADTTAFDTLDVAGDRFQRLDLAGLPSVPFMIRVERGARQTTQYDVAVKTVEGCCGYSVAGYYKLTLPRIPR